MGQIDLFTGEVVDEFRSAIERYGQWPMTVWPLSMQNKKTKRWKALIGDLGGDRESAGKAFGYQSTASIFNPQLASAIYAMFAKGCSRVVDPFAGGGTRAILAAAHGMEYAGTEIRKDEARSDNERIGAAGYSGAARVVVGDARKMYGFLGGGYDFLLTCPPYWNLEKYEGGESDLSMIDDYRVFCDALAEVVEQSHLCLKPRSLSCWVVGMHRDGRGKLRCMNHEVARIHAAHGFELQEEIVLHVQNNGAIQRVGQFDKGNRRLVRVHEYLMVFRRGG